MCRLYAAIIATARGAERRRNRQDPINPAMADVPACGTCPELRVYCARLPALRPSAQLFSMPDAILPRGRSFVCDSFHSE